MLFRNLGNEYKVGKMFLIDDVTMSLLNTLQKVSNLREETCATFRRK